MAKALACPLPRDAPALRLVCLPHAGGAAAAYRAWAAELPDTVELHIYQPPGRGALPEAALRPDRGAAQLVERTTRMAPPLAPLIFGRWTKWG